MSVGVDHAAARVEAARRSAPGGGIRVREYGVVEYLEAVERMRAFTASRTARTRDEIWFLEHPPVYTRGVRCRSDPPPATDGVAVVDSDRGGRITYHGPGQLIAYLLLDLRRRAGGVRRLVHDAEQAVIDALAGFGVEAARRAGAPGVYVADAKIAALGFRVRRGCAYHGLSLNWDVDPAAFARIDPCGYPGLAVANLRPLAPRAGLDAVRVGLEAQLLRILS